MQKKVDVKWHFNGSDTIQTVINKFRKESSDWLKEGQQIVIKLIQHLSASALSLMHAFLRIRPLSNFPLRTQFFC